MLQSCKLLDTSDIYHHVNYLENCAISTHFVHVKTGHRSFTIKAESMKCTKYSTKLMS
jgi:hypothetical protein